MDGSISPEPVAIHTVPIVPLGTLLTESRERNAGARFTSVRSITNAGVLTPTATYFDNVRTSTDTSQYKVVRPGAFAYNPARINVGSIGRSAEDDPVIVSPMYVVFEVDGSLIDDRYLLHWLKSSLGRSRVAGRVEEGARFRLPFQSLSKVEIPLPSLTIQCEIVRMLDAFAALVTNLEDELTARRRQYAHYRDSLLTFADQPGVSWAALNEVGRFIRGKRFTKADFDTDGVGCIHYGEIYTHYGTSATKVVSHLRRELAPNLRYAEPGDVVIVDVGETVEDVGKAVAWLGDQRVAIHDHSYAFRHALNPSFISYVMQTGWFKREAAKYIARTKVKTLLVAGFSKIEIPVPSLEEQARLVAILDKFDALANDESSGLPAEIAARRKQYEYYRDQLLSFEEKVA